jgi:LuxR family maltose regulon positive regulatory protein
MEKVEAGKSGKVTLVSAPAGFGKTTLVSAWLTQLAHEQIAWFSLDENDNDPVRFLAYLIAALQTAVPHLGQTAEQALQSPQPPPSESILTLLINDISQHDQSLILVLDDYHVITTPTIHQALTFLIEHLPPQLHLLLTTRSDPPLPLSRLRPRTDH